jgi:hypothetical protein
VALAGVLQRRSPCRVSRAAGTTSTAPPGLANSAAWACVARRFGASIDAAQDGAEHVRRLGGARDAVRRLGLRFPVTTLGADGA